jgi:hypothetical protein
MAADSTDAKPATAPIWRWRAAPVNDTLHMHGHVKRVSCLRWSKTAPAGLWARQRPAGNRLGASVRLEGDIGRAIAKQTLRVVEHYEHANSRAASLYSYKIILCHIALSNTEEGLDRLMRRRANIRDERPKFLSFRTSTVETDAG